MSRPRYDVVLYVDPEYIPELADELGTDTGQIKKMEQVNQNGWKKVFLEFETAEEALKRVLGFGSNVEVVGPTELKNNLTQSIKRLSDMYQVK
jgi:predicted DNA-binding transcriptional regulator YafY